jgi:hypothetical protein
MNHLVIDTESPFNTRSDGQIQQRNCASDPQLELSVGAEQCTIGRGGGYHLLRSLPSSSTSGLMCKCDTVVVVISFTPTSPD